jgi:hypothetical protein
MKHYQNTSPLWRYQSIAIALLLFICFAPGQSHNDTVMSSQYTSSILVPSTGDAAFADIPVATSTGRNAIFIQKSTENISISLILPGGTEVDSANATAFGYTFVESGPSAQAVTQSPVDSVMGPNTILIQFPTNTPAGAYQVKAWGTGISVDAAITVQYLAESGVKSAIRMDASRAQVGSAVTLSGFVFDFRDGARACRRLTHQFPGPPNISAQPCSSRSHPIK